MIIQLFWNMMVYRCAGVYRCFEGTLCLHLQGFKGQIYAPFVMKLKCSFKILGKITPVRIVT